MPSLLRSSTTHTSIKMEIISLIIGILLFLFAVPYALAWSDLFFTIMNENEIIAIVTKTREKKKLGKLVKFMTGIENTRVDNKIIVDAPKKKNKGWLGLGIHFVGFTYGILTQKATGQLVKMRINKGWQDIRKSIEVSGEEIDSLHFLVQHPFLATEKELQPTPSVGGSLPRQDIVDILFTFQGKIIDPYKFFFVHGKGFYEAVDQILDGFVEKLAGQINYEILRGKPSELNNAVEQCWNDHGRQQLIDLTGFEINAKDIAISSKDRAPISKAIDIAEQKRSAAQANSDADKLLASAPVRGIAEALAGKSKDELDAIAAVSMAEAIRHTTAGTVVVGGGAKPAINVGGGGKNK